MATVKRFEDLEVWKDAREYVKIIYELSTKDVLKKDYAFKDQIRRASISIMNNIAEGFGRYNNKEFRRFLDIAAASNLEVKSMLYLGFDLEYIAKSKIDDLIQQNEKLHFQLLALIKYLRSKSN
ncbi:four helix bundle protein [Marivirga arenosa]|uniref:Four helix bundle protein n=1 Tax=Marivirga arenosa TaxID=3059076 RepID=A0AA49GHB8_9BACT|nr:four helix bundle protein [Marivirga sp. ABR2-2]WKK83683.2 four helix bundle protein [Marivirga sp. ABR2-2]